MNQAFLLKRFGKEAANMIKWAGDVKSGDPENIEARAAEQLSIIGKYLS